MKNLNEKKNVRFIVDFLNKKIIGTKASFDKASKGYGEIYEELASKVAAHPEFVLDVKEQKHRSNKKKETYPGLNYNFIEAYINTRSNAEYLMREYQSVKEFAEASSRSAYPIVKKWFLGEFESFDMDKAKNAIAEHLIDTAVLNVEPVKAPATQNDENDHAA